MDDRLPGGIGGRGALWTVPPASGHLLGALPDLAAATEVWQLLFGSEDEVVAAGIDVIRKHWA